MSSRRLGWAMLAMVVLSLAVGGGSVLASKRYADQSLRKLCAVVVSSDDQYRETPPESELGRKQADNFARLRRDLGCP